MSENCYGIFRGVTTDPTKRDNTRYWEFHRDHGHRTDDCIQLRKEIEYLIRRWYLRRYIASEGQDQVQPPPPRQPTPTQHQQPLGEIHVISGGFAGGGESNSARKAHLRSIRSGEVMEVQAVSKFPRLDTAITFSDSDLEGCRHPHDDPLVIKAVVANKTIHRVLVDNGSSADIIFASTFDKMGIEREKLDPVSNHLQGFSGEKMLPLGSIQLVLTLGDPPCQTTTTVRFPIVDAPLSLQRIIRHALSQRHKSHPFHVSHGDQVPHHKQSRNGSRRPTRGQGMLLGINEAKSGR